MTQEEKMKISKTALGFILFILGVFSFGILFAESTTPTAKSEPENCPKPEMFIKINEAYGACLKDPGNENKALVFVHLLKKAMYKYNCPGRYQPEPVPAWWLCGKRMYVDTSSEQSPEYWFDLLSKLKFPEAKKLFGGKLFRSTLSGYYAEMYLVKSEKVEKELAKSAK